MCSSPDTNKNNFMTEMSNLKMEARKLLDEVNQNFEKSPKGVRIYNNWPYDVENISFKERVKNLRQKIHAASSTSTDIAVWLLSCNTVM